MHGHWVVIFREGGVVLNIFPIYIRNTKKAKINLTVYIINIKKNAHHMHNQPLYPLPTPQLPPLSLHAILPSIIQLLRLNCGEEEEDGKR